MIRYQSAFMGGGSLNATNYNLKKRDDIIMALFLAIKFGKSKKNIKMAGVINIDNGMAVYYQLVHKF